MNAEVFVAYIKYCLLPFFTLRMSGFAPPTTCLQSQQLTPESEIICKGVGWDVVVYPSPQQDARTVYRTRALWSGTSRQGKLFRAEF